MSASSSAVLAEQQAPADPGRPAPAGVADPALGDWLLDATAVELDALPFGVICMALDATVEHYNAAEARCAGLTAARVVGRNFFARVAPCMNNAMIAHRFLQDPEVDDLIDYVLTFRMAPQRVRLRLLKPLDARRMCIAVERRS